MAIFIIQLFSFVKNVLLFFLSGCFIYAFSFVLNVFTSHTVHLPRVDLCDLRKRPKQEEMFFTDAARFSVTPEL